MGKKANLKYAPGYKGTRVAPVWQSVFSCVKPGSAPRLSRHGNKWRLKKWRIKNREERIKREEFFSCTFVQFPEQTFQNKIKCVVTQTPDLKRLSWSHLTTDYRLLLTTEVSPEQCFYILSSIWCLKMLFSLLVKIDIDIRKMMKFCIQWRGKFSSRYRLKSGISTGTGILNYSSPLFAQPKDTYLANSELQSSRGIG